jgi:hypothetical protein
MHERSDRPVVQVDAWDAIDSNNSVAHVEPCLHHNQPNHDSKSTVSTDNVRPFSNEQTG